MFENTRFRIITVFYCTFIILILIGCSKDENPIPANTISLKLDGKDFLVDMQKSSLSINGSTHSMTLLVYGSGAQKETYIEINAYSIDKTIYHPYKYDDTDEIGGEFGAYFSSVYIPCSGRTLEGYQTYSPINCSYGGFQQDLVLDVKNIKTNSRTASGTFSGIFCKNGCDKRIVENGKFNISY